MSAVVGLDLSLTATGIATPDGVTTIVSKGLASASLIARGVRLQHTLARIVSEVADATRGADDTLVVIEAPSLGQARQRGTHDRSGLWWLVVSEIASWDGIDIAEVTPAARAKYATGKGNAGKDEVLAAVVRRYPDVLVRNNNEADALVLRAMGCDWLGTPLVVVPQAHRAALDKVAWPETAGAA